VAGVLGMWMDSYAPGGPDADKTTLNIYFHATPEETADPRIDPNEVAEIAWFAPDELPEAVAFPGHIPAVLRAWRESVGARPRSRAPLTDRKAAPAVPAVTRGVDAKA
jgi:hypothetical protein